MSPQFSPDGRFLAYISDLPDRTLRIRPLATAVRSTNEYNRWFEKGVNLSKSGDAQASLSALRNAVRCEPTNPAPHRMLAETYEDLARNEKNPYLKFDLLRAAEFEAEQLSEEKGRETASRVKAHVQQIRDDAYAGW